MKHRTHPDFPSYRFYQDGRIMNKATHNFVKVKQRMKLVSAYGHRKSVTVQKYFALLFPNIYTWRDGRGNQGSKNPSYIPIRKDDPIRNPKKYDKAFVEKVQKEATNKTWDRLVKEYNIPIGSIGYLLRKGKGNPQGKGRFNIRIHIDRVIIRK